MAKACLKLQCPSMPPNPSVYYFTLTLCVTTIWGQSPSLCMPHQKLGCLNWKQSVVHQEKESVSSPHFRDTQKEKQLPKLFVSNNNYEKNTKESRLWKPGKSEVSSDSNVCL